MRNERGWMERLRELGAQEAFLKIRAQVDRGACLHGSEALAGAVEKIEKSLLPAQSETTLKEWHREL